MITFKDLEFEKLDNEYLSGKRCKIQFENGYGASIVSHTRSYGGDEGLYEVAVLFDNIIHYDNPVANGDVIGYLNEDDVNDIIIKIQKL